MVGFSVGLTSLGMYRVQTIVLKFKGYSTLSLFSCQCLDLVLGSLVIMMSSTYVRSCDDLS